jgi:hypothetical protein
MYCSCNDGECITLLLGSIGMIRRFRPPDRWSGGCGRGNQRVRQAIIARGPRGEGLRGHPALRGNSPAIEARRGLLPEDVDVRVITHSQVPPRGIAKLPPRLAQRKPDLSGRPAGHTPAPARRPALPPPGRVARARTLRIEDARRRSRRDVSGPPSPQRPGATGWIGRESGASASQGLGEASRLRAINQSVGATGTTYRGLCWPSRFSVSGRGRTT